MMKTSKYNIYLEKKDKFFIFNQLTGAFDEVDSELFHFLREKRELNSCSTEILEELKNGNYICDDNLIEENVILRTNRELRYGNHVARITVLPTIDCNFKCWYCYENHVKSEMSITSVNAVISFIENLLSTHNLKVLLLDWFGGEPLLYFNEVMYPISKAVLDLCSKANVEFSHTITTNGYLITPDLIIKMKEIKLNSFQITLDGSSFYHNRTRFSQTDKETYTTIINNITSLCNNIPNIRLTLRINYTPKNISTIQDIAYSFPVNIRKKIHISPQIVWQFKKEINEIGNIIKEKLKFFSENGYIIDNLTCSAYSGGCYVENMLQFVINYDLNVYKCTARDFNDVNNAIGYLDEDGNLIVNSNYYNYFQSSFFENPKCLECNLLPSCSGMCIQKKIEKALPTCPKDAVLSSLMNKLELMVEANY